MTLHEHVTQQLMNILSDPSASELGRLETALRLLAKWRSTLISNTLSQNYGNKILSGPFKGMKFVAHSAEGCHAPKLIGCYEQELHSSIEKAIKRNYKHIVNIGAAEGYYAVGLALRIPNAQVHAFDTNEKAHPILRKVAEENNVLNRISIEGTFSCKDLILFPPKQTLILCDIEGAEETLLDPSSYTELLNFDFIVELHECFKKGITKVVEDRFCSTHTIEIIHARQQAEHLPEILQKIGHLDQLLSVWEWRAGPTPWAVMLQKH